jgi:hypothetical protein
MRVGAELADRAALLVLAEMVVVGLGQAIMLLVVPVQLTLVAEVVVGLAVLDLMPVVLVEAV